jgi:hypothetical protein
MAAGRVRCTFAAGRARKRPGKGRTMTDTQPLHLTLDPLFSFRGSQVQVWQDAPPDSPDATRGAALATIDLNRRILLRDGASYAIRVQGAPWSRRWSLWRGDAPAPGDSPLAIFRRESLGMLRSRPVLRVGTDPGNAYLLRRRSRWGGPSNVDVVALPFEGQDARSAGPVLLRVERVGRRKRSLQALLLDPRSLPLPIALFVLSLLAAQERAAAAASA